ncbi:hypothetical protein D9M68_392250 [compost metagenome]
MRGRLAIILQTLRRIDRYGFSPAIEVAQRQRGSRLTPLRELGQFPGRSHNVPRNTLPACLHFGEPDLGAHIPPADRLTVKVLRKPVVEHRRLAL